MSGPTPITTLRYAPQPLTAQAFAAFGEVVEHGGNERRRFLPGLFAHDALADLATAWVSRLEAAVTLPLRVEYLERHAHSAQTFVPLTDTPYLVFVAPSLADGQPDMAAAQAFVASASQGICYRTGTWHFGLSPLRGPCEFLVIMHKSSQAGVQDDEFLSLCVQGEILAPCTP